jgi:two-component system response regulator GlrR
MSDAIRVLLVDDDESMGELLEARLRTRGFAVSVALSPSRALELVERDAFDLVVTDLMMQEMNGLELCERLAKMRPGLPVVLLTGHGTFEAAVAALRLRAYDFLTKPVDVDLLVDVAQRAVGRGPRTRRRAGAPLPEPLGELAPLAEVEREYIERVIRAAGGNKSLAAQILGVDRRTIYRKAERRGR